MCLMDCLVHEWRLVPRLSQYGAHKTSLLKVAASATKEEEVTVELIKSPLGDHWLVNEFFQHCALGFIALHPIQGSSVLVTASWKATMIPNLSISHLPIIG